MHESESKDAEVWPPPPLREVAPKPAKTSSYGIGLMSLLISGMGLFCIIQGCSGPNQAGLSGGAFRDAFEADEALMLWLLAGVPLSLVGMMIGSFYVRTWNGKIGITLALLSGVWAFIRRNHF
jgi:hypothetical protein